MASAALPRPVAAATLAQNSYANKWFIALGVTTAAVMELIDTSIVNVALAQMSANLGATLDEVAWVSTAYIVAAVIVLPMTGWLSAYFGRKKYFTASIIVFTIASFLCGQSTSLVELVLWRIVQGLGGGGLIATSQAILFESFPPDEATLAAAIFGIGMMIGPAIGPTLGGVIVDRYTWPWIFYINLPFGAAAAVFTWFYLKDSLGRQRARRIDILGILLIMIGIGSLQFVLERGQHYDWFDSTLITGTAVLAVLSILGLIAWELWVDEPILDLRVLKDRSLASGSLFAAALGVVLYGSVFALPIFIQQLLGYSAETAGWALFPSAIGGAIAFMLLARFARKVPDLRWVIVFGALCVIYSMVLYSHFTMVSDRHDMLWPVLLRGFGTGLIFVPLSTATVAHLRGRAIEQGSAIFNLTRQLGGSIGIAILATELTRRAAIHRVDLVGHVVNGAWATMHRLGELTRGLEAYGFDPLTAHHKALGILDRMVESQATMLAFSDIFVLVGGIMLASIPLIALLRRPPGGRMRMGE